VIVITAHDSPGTREQARRCGAAAYLAKPFEGGALLAAIDDATGVLHPGAN
jgi:DNA-binding response OmpR family regulator